MRPLTICGCHERFGDGTPALKLPTNRVKVVVRDGLPGWSRDVIWQWIDEGYRRWAGVCDIGAERIADVSDAGPRDVVHWITVADLGNSGVLADQQLPSRGANVLVMRINNRIRWKPTDGPMAQGGIDPVRTLTHEIGHFLGLQHFPQGAPPELMEPSILDTIIAPQPTEARVVAGWYGAPIGATPNPQPNPTPPKRDRIIIEFDGAIPPFTVSK